MGHLPISDRPNTYLSTMQGKSSEMKQGVSESEENSFKEAVSVSKLMAWFGTKPMPVDAICVLEWGHAPQWNGV